MTGGEVQYFFVKLYDNTFQRILLRLRRLRIVVRIGN